MKFTKQDLINALKANVDKKGCVYFVGKLEYYAQILIEHMEKHQESSKEIDIDKACDAYCKCCETHECESQGVNKEDCYFRQQFRKAMEE